MLRMGSPFGRACALGIEDASSELFYCIDDFSSNISRMKHFQSKLVLFHMFEEVEHSALTVQSLKKKTTFFMRLLALVPMSLVCTLFLISPPILAILTSPSILFKRNPITTLLDLLAYYAVMVPIAFITIYRLTSVYLSPWTRGESQARHLKLQKHFHKRVTEEGIKFEVEETEEYTLRY
jgi:hypothetical protein